MFNVRLHQALARLAVSMSLALVSNAAIPGSALHAQTPAAASPARQSGTVKAIDSSSITVVTAAGAQVSVPVASDATVLQLAPGQTKLSDGQPAKLTDIAVGDKVMVGKPGDTDTASRVIVIKSGDIAARNAAEQADWQKRGTSGLIKSVDGTSFTVTAGSKTVKVDTTPKTVFRRYASDSVKFQDSTAGTFDQIHAGDQLSVRGDKSADGANITAEEAVTGTFANLSGVLTAVNPAAGTVSFKDLASKKQVTVKLTANSDVRNLPAQAAAMFAQRSNPSAAGGGAAGGGAPGGGGAPAGGGYGGGQGRPGGAGGAGGGSARAGMDLSRMLARLPTGTVADLKPGNAVMIVASPGADSYTAITLLSGVEALLTAPAGQAPITLSPWNIGGAPEGAGGP
jgi:Domain of unknown function (DUF5666)